MPARIANIGPKGARRRRRGGVAWLIVAVAAFAIMLAAGAPRATRLLLAIPFGLAATGFLQARQKT
jgi:hypothetical protein